MRRTDAKQHHNLHVVQLSRRNGQHPHSDVEREQPLEPRLAPVDGVIEACRSSKRALTRACTHLGVRSHQAGGWAGAADPSRHR